MPCSQRGKGMHVLPNTHGMVSPGAPTALCMMCSVAWRLRRVMGNHGCCLHSTMLLHSLPAVQQVCVPQEGVTSDTWVPRSSPPRGCSRG